MTIKENQINIRFIFGSYVIAVATLLLIWKFPVITDHFSLLVSDLKFEIRKYLDREPDMSSSFVLVGLDDSSKIDSGYEYLWPYDYYAQTVKKITDGNPNSFGMDIIFTNSVDTTGWSSLIGALSESYMAINPYVAKFGSRKNPLDVNLNREIIEEIKFDDLPLSDEKNINHIESIIYKTHKSLQEVSSGIGYANIEHDSDGVLRRLPIVSELDGMLVPHLFLKLFSEHLSYDLSNMELKNSYSLLLHKYPTSNGEKTLEIPLDGYGNMLINYMSYEKIQYQMKRGQFYSLSAWPLLNSNQISFKDKTVLFGDLSLAARDVSPTPMNGQMHNPLIFLVAMSNILNESFITPFKGSWTLIQIVLLTSILLFFVIRMKPFEFGLLTLSLFVSYILVNFSLFVYYGKDIVLMNVIIPAAMSAVYLIVYSIYESQVKMGVLEGSLESYLSPHLMDKIKNDPDMLKLGGERKRISVLFSDIAGFTSFTDKADPAEVQLVLEEYFSIMTSIIFKNKGVVDKYMGDGILAFFENPKDGVTSAQASIKTAIEMKAAAVKLDQKYKEQKRFPFSIYVGIATGYAKVGNIGPPEKVDYTIIGSVVNKAARLDGAGDAGDILMDEDTYFFVKSDYDIEDFGEHSLKGFESPVKIYRIK